MILVSAEPKEADVRRAMILMWHGDEKPYDNYLPLGDWRRYITINGFEYGFFTDKPQCDAMGFTPCGIKGLMVLCYRKENI